MPDSTVLIATPETLTTLKEKLDTGGELYAFEDSELLTALEHIAERKPGTVMLEQSFAASSRGSALLARIQADPALTGCKVWIMAEGGEPEPAPLADSTRLLAPAALDHRGTRRAPRFRVRTNVEILVEGSVVTLVDLSAIGAQVLSPTVLKPNQRVRVVLPEEGNVVRLAGLIAWAKFEIPRAQPEPHYRAGLEFIDHDQSHVERFLARHKLD
jgi:hypothetical protein